MKKLTLISAFLALAGCASQPDDIQTAYVSDLQFDNYDCGQLQQEAARISRKASDLRGHLQETADNDAAQMGIGLVLFWPTLFLLEGGDGVQAQEYSRLKGEREAIERVSVQKKCGIRFASINNQGSSFSTSQRNDGPIINTPQISHLLVPSVGEEIDGRILANLLPGSKAQGEVNTCVNESAGWQLRSNFEITFQPNGIAQIGVDCSFSHTHSDIREELTANWSIQENKLCLRNISPSESQLIDRCSEVIRRAKEYRFDRFKSTAFSFSLQGNTIPSSIEAQIDYAVEKIASNN